MPPPNPANLPDTCRPGRDKRDAGNADAHPPLQSGNLLLGGRVRAIEHGDQRYFLRLTRNGKLILGK
ncbi:MAG: hemin uptake protein HemP [Alphaproteobacteria bacterium]|nr:hemin uptake protein HemP [Alphaproteobacteria bacterium]MDE2014502.1 hemin uptake protein HemP [Alphaproteobacteria bacterium]MDE2075316.1 hemin uptake protein HemP [Alphaproteobacteria bacterium]